MKRIVEDVHVEEHQITIGVEFGSLGMIIDNQAVKL